MIKKTINGAVYEFESVKELVQFEKEMSGVKEQTKTPRPKKQEISEIKRVRKQRGLHKKTIDNLIKAKEIMNKGERFREAFEKASGRSVCGQDYANYRKFFKEEIPDIGKRISIKVKKPSNLKKSDSDKRVIRGKFIGNRTNYYMRTNNWSREKAWSQAVQDWDSHSSLGKVSPQKKKVKKQIKMEELEFPSVYPLSEEAIPVLESMVRHMIANQDKLTYFNVKDHLQVIPDFEWTGRLWHEFCKQFFLNSEQIAKAMNVKNKFKVAKVSGFDIIWYGKYK